MVLGEPCFWQELQEKWCKHFITKTLKVMTSVMSSLYASFCIHMLQSEGSIFGGTSQIMNIYWKPSCDIIIICFPDKTIFILPGCFMWLLQIQRLAKYYHCANIFILGWWSWSSLLLVITGKTLPHFLYTSQMFEQKCHVQLITFSQLQDRATS